MKTRTCIAVIFALSMAAAAYAQESEKVYLVEITDFSQIVSHRIMTVDKYKDLRKETMLKNRYVSKALKQAKKEWESSEEDSTMADNRFPGNVAKPGVVKSLGMFASQEKAQAKLDDIVAEEQRKEEQRAKKQSGIERQIEEIKKHLKATQADGQMDESTKRTRIKNFEMQIETLEEELAQREEKEREKEYNLTIARELFNRQMEKLLEEKDKPRAVKKAPVVAPAEGQ